MNGKRVFIFDELLTDLRSKPRGGKGEMIGRVVIPDGQPLAMDSPFIASGVNSILPDSGIGFHKHVHDEEVYIIISGQGEYIDNDEKCHKVKAGDIMFCCKGESHGLFNTGTEPLVFGAVIAK